jgi:hypothetical protein
MSSILLTLSNQSTGIPAMPNFAPRQAPMKMARLQQSPPANMFDLKADSKDDAFNKLANEL